MADLKIGKHYAEYLRQRIAMGVSPQEAAGMSGAMQAAELDRADLAKRQRSATTAELLGNDADKPFANAQERQNAFGKRDAQGKKLYETSAAYREAVQRKVVLSSDAVAGYQNPMANVPSEQRMLQAAEEELYNAKRSDLFHKSASKDPVVAAQARYDLIAFHQAPENQAIMERFERTEFEERPLQYALKAAKARGERVGTSLQPTQEQIDQIEKHPYDAFGVERAAATATDENGNVDHNVGVS